ncbi:MAG: hypothetical protein KH031_05165 [Clostridiales bacterium]|nr:hypothetical protein [Clostridiales bacterium]
MKIYIIINLSMSENSVNPVTTDKKCAMGLKCLKNHFRLLSESNFRHVLGNFQDADEY